MAGALTIVDRRHRGEIARRDPLGGTGIGPYGKWRTRGGRRRIEIELHGEIAGGLRRDRQRAIDNDIAGRALKNLPARIDHLAGAVEVELPGARIAQSI